jgi:hypothetical protein
MGRDVSYPYLSFAVQRGMEERGTHKAKFSHFAHYPHVNFYFEGCKVEGFLAVAVA